MRAPITLCRSRHIGRRRASSRVLESAVIVARNRNVRHASSLDLDPIVKIVNRARDTADDGRSELRKFRVSIEIIRVRVLSCKSECAKVNTNAAGNFQRQRERRSGSGPARFPEVLRVEERSFPNVHLRGRSFAEDRPILQRPKRITHDDGTALRTAAGSCGEPTGFHVHEFQ